MTRTLLVLLVTLPPTVGAQYPHVVLSNRTVQALVYLPDATNGYYRATRFDWSGMIGAVEYGGHKFFGQYRARPHDPTHTEDAVGPAAEFGMSDPPGYATGDTFLKIGIGRLRKPAEPKYWFANRYEILDPGRWRVTHGRDWITFTQVLPGAYIYSKRIRLTRAGFVLHHRLKNIGRQALVTDHYIHNFVVFDDQPVGTNHAVELPSPVATQTVRDTLHIEGRIIRYLTEPHPEMGYRAELKPTPGNAATFTFGGRQLSFRGNRRPTKMIFYGIGKAVCLEPFLDIHLNPGEVFTWNSAYEIRISGCCGWRCAGRSRSCCQGRAEPNREAHRNRADPATADGKHGWNALN